VVAGIATAGAFLIDLVGYASFLYLLGAFFVPLFGVLLADWLLAGMRYERSSFFAAPRVRVGPLVAWLAGFSLYQWLEPVGPGWWTSLVANTHAGSVAIGGSLPSLALAFLLTGSIGLLGRKLLLAPG
jgi:purine-cytosine permease-like protein